MRLLGAGEYIHRVKIEKNVGTRNPDTGEVEKDWTTILSRYAKVESLSGRELLIASQINATSTVRITIRYYAPLTAEMQFVFQGRSMEINNISDTLEQHIQQVCLCTELG